MQHDGSMSARFAVRSRPARCALQAFALLAGAVGALSLGATPAGASSEAGTGGANALHLPGSWEGELPGADGTVRWHLDLLPEQRYRLRRTYEGKPAPNQFDELGRWTRAADGSRLDLHRAGAQVVQFLIGTDGSLRKLDAAGKPMASGINDRLERLPQPMFIEPHLKLSGLFIYMADAGVITLCADGSRMPVAKEGDFVALETAYRKARPALGEAQLVSVEARIAPRPSIEEGAPPLDTLAVQRFISLSPHGTCDGAHAGTASPPLQGTAWVLSSLGGRQPPAGATATARFEGGECRVRTAAIATVRRLSSRARTCRSAPTRRPPIWPARRR